MDEDKFAALILRYQKGNCTHEEKELIEKWFKSRSEGEPFGQLSQHEQDEMIRRISHNLYSRIQFIDKEPVLLPETGRSDAFRLFYRIAASIILLTAVSYGIWRYGHNNDLLSQRAETEFTSVSSTSGNISKVLLADGSIVWLKGNSTLTYPNTFEKNERMVTLQGEAFFEVEKNPDRPFVIHCGDLITKVVGTSFNIRSNESDIEVMVLTGKVALSSKRDNRSVVVLPNEKAVYHESGKTIERIKVEEKEAQATVVGTEYNMKFKAVRMNEVVRRIERKFNVKVTMSDPGLGQCMITANFTDQSLARVLSMISQSLQLEYEVKNRIVSLSGTGCDEPAP